jgi:hypothetical protein
MSLKSHNLFLLFNHEEFTQRHKGTKDTKKELGIINTKFVVKFINNLVFVWFVVNFLVFFLLSNILHAQSSTFYQIPRRIFVGDPAVLVLPLPAVSVNNPDIVLTESFFPVNEDIDFHRIILERRTTGSRLMIEFTAYVPGVLELPVIEIGGEYFTGLSITITSILDGRSDRVLSGAASTLAMPGTAFLLFGSMAALVLFLLLIVWFIVKGRVVLRDLRQKWKHFRLFAGIRKVEKRLHRDVVKGLDKRIILDKLSDETRIFLSVLTGKNCRAMTASEIVFEFEMLPTEALFGDFFRRCDEFRFSGTKVDSQDILGLLTFLRSHVAILAKSKKHKEKKAA